jgi:hypothetical protein
LVECAAPQLPFLHFTKQVAALFRGIFIIPMIGFATTSFLSTFATKEKKQKNAA